LNSKPEHLDLSRHAWQTFSLSKIPGKNSKTFSMASIMGSSSAQTMLLKVQDDLRDNAGVYAIIGFTSLHLFILTFGLSERLEEG
jgi:hypothetical protein